MVRESNSGQTRPDGVVENLTPKQRLLMEAGAVALDAATPPIAANSREVGILIGAVVDLIQGKPLQEVGRKVLFSIMPAFAGIFGGGLAEDAMVAAERAVLEKFGVNTKDFPDSDIKTFVQDLGKLKPRNTRELKARQSWLGVVKDKDGHKYYEMAGMAVNRPPDAPDDDAGEFKASKPNPTPQARANSKPQQRSLNNEPQQTGTGNKTLKRAPNTAPKAGAAHLATKPTAGAPHM